MTNDVTQQFLIYQSEDGRTHIQVALDAETLWLSQKQLTALFGKAKGTISEHIKHIFEDGELAENSVVRYFRTTGLDAKTYNVAHYNLDMVLALGFRVRSTVAVRFRQWANRQIDPFALSLSKARAATVLTKYCEIFRTINRSSKLLGNALLVRLMLCLSTGSRRTVLFTVLRLTKTYNLRANGAIVFASKHPINSASN